MVAFSSTVQTRPPALLEATKKSTTLWQNDLQAVFDHAKDRFPDVVWELGHDETTSGIEEIWGHKAIVYARAPPSFQARYFSFRPAPVTSPVPYSTSPNGSIPAHSALSLTIGADYLEPSRSPSPFRTNSPSPSTTPGTILRLPISMSPALFSNELEYLYTGKGFGAAFEFLFDTFEKRTEGDAEENRIDQLRKDLVFMWRSRLFSDVRIALTGNSHSDHEDTSAVFSSHRFILVSRSPYFYAELISFGGKPTPNAPLTLNLPSPPFTPASLHFTLGFIYTGTLNFSNRTFDLETSFHVMRSATYLSLQTLYDEIQARIVQEMMHGLFHAFLEFSEYERITGGKWGTGGCRCRQCARRAPRVLEFAVSEDVQNPYLERGARRALVGLFGEGWCTPEFGTLPQKTKDGLLKGLAKRTVPMNIFPLMFAAQAAMTKLNGVLDAWADTTREMVLSARKIIDEILCAQSEACFEQAEWVQLMESDGSRFEDGEKVEWVMDAVLRGLNEKNAGIVYQTLVSSILLRPHSTEVGKTLLSSISHMRVQVEQTRMDVVRWLRRRWVGVRQEGGFDPLEGWSIKEISHEIDVPVDDLISPSPSMPVKGMSGRTSRRASLAKDGDAESASLHSLRASVLNRNMVRHTPGDSGRDPLASSASSVRSVARSTASRTTTSTTGPRNSRRKATDTDSRPDSKLTPTPSQSVISSSFRSSAASAHSQTSSILARSSAPAIGVRRGPNRSPEDLPRPKSTAGSVSSVRSHASTVRKTNAGAGPSTLRPPVGLSRPSSTVSTASDASTTFKTAPESATSRTRRTSTASTLSTVSTVSTRNARSPIPPLPKVTRPRHMSTSTTSTASSIATTGAKRSVGRDASNALLSPPARRSPSAASVRSTASTVSRASTRGTARKFAADREKKRDSAPEPPPKENVKPAEPENTASTITVKGKGRADALNASEKKSDGTSTPKGSIRRKESNDTITLSSAPTVTPLESTQLKGSLPLSPRGATLEIGIPCIISSKRKRFRAFARYIGEVEGESGPWVGVEVPVGESWAEERLEGPQWNDGTWGGIRYFALGGGSEWGDEDRTARRRRMDWVNGQKGVKREGDQLNVDRTKRLRSVSPAVSDVSNSEYRGLFVRPQQVLYVVDAVGSDL